MTATAANPWTGRGQKREFVASPNVADIETPHLTDAESAKLLDCINKVRSGEEQYLVILSNKKVTGGHKRVAGEDYAPIKALTPNGHLGWLLRAPTNQKTGAVYIYVFDKARELAGRNGHTNITMAGIRSFRVLASRPGPRPQPAPQEAPKLEQQPAPQPAPQAFNPQAMLAQAMFLQAQAMFQMASYLTLQQIQQPQLTP